MARKDKGDKKAEKGGAALRTFYIVTNSYDDKGRVTAALTGTVEAAEKPKSESKHLGSKDIYVDYFDSLADAKKFVEESKRA